MTFADHSGNVLRTDSFARFALTEIVYTTPTSIPQHAHRRACFSYVIRGSYSETYRGSNIQVGSNALLYRPAEALHSDRFEERGTKCLLIEFHPEWLRSTFDHPAALFSGPSVHHGDDLNWLVTRLRHEAEEADDLTPISVEALILELVVAVARKSAKHDEAREPRWLSKARQILHDRFAEPIALTEVAIQVGVHPVYLATTFRKRYGCTVGEYLRRVRIDFAAGQLARAETPLTELAIAAGFSDQAHFSRTFKRITGMSPGQYRAHRLSDRQRS